jgi:cytochrome c oxidase cbb3-type subunit 3
MRSSCRRRPNASRAAAALGVTARCALALTLALPACERETRTFRDWPPSASAGSAVREVDLQAGPHTRDVAVHNEYDDNAYAVSEGKRLYNAFNCSGCHFQGGGGIGPPLMDAEWIYGSRPENIYETIVEGRPNGMPSFRGKLGNDQVWQLVAYVRSLSGLLAKDVAPGRNDGMQVRSQEQSTEKAVPIQSPPPK